MTVQPHVVINLPLASTEYSWVIPAGAQIVTFQNREGDTEILFGPFASSRSGPASEHQGLGLYLVRLIAAQCGGTASIANFDDGSGVQASIVLPLAS